MKYYFLTLFSLLFLAQNMLAQNDGNDLFDNSYLHEIRITFEGDDFWQVLTDNYNNSIDDNTGVPTNVPYLEGIVSIDGNIIDSIGLRQKGFSSHFGSNQFKKSLKLDFNEFIPGQKYDGLKKINLLNGVGDPAMQRDFLAYNIMREAGIRSARTAYAKVYLNDTYWGLYLIVEQLDKTFIQNNFADDAGDLYKNIAWSTLAYNGDNATDYDGEIALRTNESTSDFSDFIELADVLNNTPDNEFAESIVEVFNVDYYLRVMAVDIMLDNWDSYISFGRNFYLYHEPTSGHFFWIPWDYNLSMGGQFGGGSGNGGPFLPDDPADCETILNGSCPYPATDSIFIATINDDSYCCNVDWDNICQDLYDEISMNGIDTFPADLGDCESILNGSCPYPPDDSIFIQVINIESSCCTEDWTGFCQFLYDDIIAGTGPQYTDFPLFLNDPEKTLVERILEVPEFREQYLNYACQILENNFTLERLEPIIDYNGALITDAIAEDLNYAFTFEDFNYDISEGDGTHPIPTLKEFINHRIEFLEQNLLDLGHVCENTNSFVAWHDVVINEFVAANDSLSGIVDQNGQADDWIELYNNTDAVIDLTDFYLTDDFTNSKKWAFPAGTSIGIDDYLIVWADEDGNQEGFHANFKLAASGEQLMLAHFNGTIIDSLSYGLQTANIPSARLPNGTGEFTENMPTFGGNNEEPTATTELRKISFKVYPNPAKDYITLDFGNNMQKGNIEIRISNLLGQLIYSTKNTNYVNLNINVKNWNSGIYLIEIGGDNFRSVEKVVVK